MTGSSASEAVELAALAAVARLGQLNGVYRGEPVRAAFPYARVEAGLEADWSHKSGEGREVQLAVSIFDQGDRPQRLRVLMAQAEAAVAAIPPAQAGWRVVTSRFMRARIAGDAKAGWAGFVEFRVRLLADAG